MQTEKVPLKSVNTNKDNPRKIDKAQFDRLVTSLLVFPEMQQLRPIVVDETGTALGGNMRYRALTAIAQKKTIASIADTLRDSRDFAKKTPQQQKRLLEYWEQWLANPTATIVRAETLTPEQKREFIIKDNVSFGDWDEEILLADFDIADLEEWGFNYDFDVDDKERLTSEEQQEYDALTKDFFLFPQSILDTRRGDWRERKKQWLDMGIKSEEGRGKELTFSKTALSPQDLSKVTAYAHSNNITSTEAAEILHQRGDLTSMRCTSIFDPVLCEVCYRWFNLKHGRILDPFAGGSVRGIVAGVLQMPYFGNDLREEQVSANYANLTTLNKDLLGNDAILPEYLPYWSVGDSTHIDEIIESSSTGFCKEKADMIFSCPPYADLEKYSDREEDLSNMDYPKFIEAYRQVIAKSCKMLKENRFAVFVVGDIRDKKGYYRDFPGDTIKAFTEAGLHYYGQLIVINQLGSGAIRARKAFSSRKIIKSHQNVIVAFKGGANARIEEYEKICVKDGMKYFNEHRTPIDTKEYVQIFYKGNNPKNINKDFPTDPGISAPNQIL